METRKYFCFSNRTALILDTFLHFIFGLACVLAGLVMAWSMSDPLAGFLPEGFAWLGWSIAAVFFLIGIAVLNKAKSMIDKLGKR